MPGMNIEMPEHIDRKLALYKTMKELKSKQEAALDILEIYFVKNPGQFEKLLNKEVDTEWQTKR